MPKMKTKSAAAKRFAVTKTGKVKRKHAYTSHLAPNKTTNAMTTMISWMFFKKTCNHKSSSS